MQRTVPARESRTRNELEPVPRHKPRTGLEHPEKTHRVIQDIPYIPAPDAIYRAITHAEPWPYKEEHRYLEERDLAFVALTYVTALRCSEARRLRVSQLVETEDGKGWMLRGVELVKAKTTRTHYVEGGTKNGAIVYKRVSLPKPRVHAHRDEVYLPNGGDRVKFTQLILRWAAKVKGEYLFPKADIDEPISRVRAWQIVNQLTGQFPHYFRVCGENYLYRAWEYDTKTLADYLQVDERTLSYYLKGKASRMPRV